MFCNLKWSEHISLLRQKYCSFSSCQQTEIGKWRPRVSRVKRILLLAFFFVSLVDFMMDHTRIDLVFMTVAIAILLWVRRHAPSDHAQRHRQPDPVGRQIGTSIRLARHSYKA
jgi:hypothetical protein